MSEDDERIFVVGRTSREGGYSGFADIPLSRVGDKVVIDTLADCGETRFYPDARSPGVSWFRGSERRNALKLFARFPKIFERCECVDVRTLATARNKSYAQKLGKEATAPTLEEKRTYVVIRSPGFCLTALRSSVDIREVLLTESEFKALAAQ